MRSREMERQRRRRRRSEIFNYHTISIRRMWAIMMRDNGDVGTSPAKIVRFSFRSFNLIVVSWVCVCLYFATSNDRKCVHENNCCHSNWLERKSAFCRLRVHWPSQRTLVASASVSFQFRLFRPFVRCCDSSVLFLYIFVFSFLYSLVPVKRHAWCMCVRHVCAISVICCYGILRFFSLATVVGIGNIGVTTKSHRFTLVARFPGRDDASVQMNDLLL